MKRLFTLFALIVTLTFLSTTFAAQCEDCPAGCSSCYWSNGFVTIVKAQNGYAIDSFNQRCYQSCKQSEYYDFNQQICVSCPQNCASCSVVNGVLTINSAARGFVVDPFNAICYAPCESTQYYDPNARQCLNCPCSGGTCKYTNGVVQTLTAPAGFSIDFAGNGCYKSCVTGQYFDGQCVNCPQFCTSCYIAGSGLIVTSAYSGYNIDSIASICYPSCASNQYYDWNNLQCVNCPQGCTSCTYSNGVVTITGFPRGWKVDTRVNICYQPCGAQQYWNSDFLTCSSCPDNCQSCEWTQGGVFITAAQSGYSIDLINQVCYLTCENNFYYQP